MVMIVSRFVVRLACEGRAGAGCGVEDTYATGLARDGMEWKGGAEGMDGIDGMYYSASSQCTLRVLLYLVTLCISWSRVALTGVCMPLFIHLSNRTIAWVDGKGESYRLHQRIPTPTIEHQAP